jgi:two-component system phosphate regulon response regulator OmpR
MSMSPHKILVVDDDHRLRELLKRYLSEQGFNVTAVADATLMDRRLQRDHFDLLILDLMLPGEDGLAICRRLRAAADPLPIIMLTAKGDDVDRIVGLELGADDYLPKPFNPRELVARIHAVLRRQPQPENAGAPLAQAQPVCFGEFVLELATRRLLHKQQAVNLTSGQYALLKTLVLQPHKPVSRAQLMATLNERDYDGTERGVDVMISRLRKIIETDPKQPRYLQTVWGVGYVFVPDGGLE